MLVLQDKLLLLYRGHQQDLDPDRQLFAEPRQLPLDHKEPPEEEAGQEEKDRGKEADEDADRLVEIEKVDVPGVNSDEDEIEIKTSVSYLSNYCTQINLYRLQLWTWLYTCF